MVRALETRIHVFVGREGGGAHEQAVKGIHRLNGISLT
jgi:hypothetical protein